MGIKLVFVIFAIIMSMKSYLANPIVMKTFSLLSNALQPRSEGRIGTGVYLRDSLRKQVLIPTFQRIKENIKEIIQVNSSQQIVISILCAAFCMTLIFMLVVMISMKLEIKKMSERK